MQADLEGAQQDEISDIVAKRRGFELSLAQGRGTKPTDYLRYIDYERKLDKLRKARAARIGASTLPLRTRARAEPRHTSQC